ncbi:TPA: biotin/lipoyl-binding protein [Vibrio vulnificus]|uniref:biotin/lipoyl-binding protein n=1 Tax=Vibrio vulnificus TaxID=672 RepID=UPI001A29E2F5|nr:biotin/lipoyl-binding protein [Vibrio vulnificus]EHY1015757.1 biotin/lipoyl-binding protein [Vibrio vulnificus]EHY1123034.1 biotin/lipoyl-binding protein [Vibrio vulnificus]EKY4883143.1 biotin/lipoyl-binding protein [Vibrio vulnificus]ELY1392744.1 biotin/lipoyl-binding protein [Vibrio vulnificus]WNJ69350.1 biotin/lipoyl-binding protein [Vibrio vulnificus]
MAIFRLIKIAMIVLLLFSILFFSSGVKFDIVSEGEGVIAINDSNVNILSPSSGIIKEINVTRGDEVSIGQKLLVITNIEDENKRDLLKHNEEIYKEQINKLTKEELELKKILSDEKYIDSLNNTNSITLLKVKNKYDTYIQKKIEFESKSSNAKDRIKSLSDQMNLLDKKSLMIKDSVGSTVRLIDSKLEREKLRLQLLESELQLEESLSLVKAAYSDFIQLNLELIDQTETELKKTRELYITSKSELSTVSERILSTDIDSNIQGTVLSLKEGLAEGVYIERNSEIMVLKRHDDGIYIDGKFDSKFRPFINLGSIAKVKINAPGIKGYFYGVISGISVDSFNYEEYSKEGQRYYSVKVFFNEEQLEFDKINNMLGIKTTLYVVNDQMTLLEYLFSVFNKDLDFTVW